jgi:hypothetical protein
MREGMYLGRPPVDIGRASSRATLGSMMRGASSYGGAAGGWLPVFAMPNGLQPGLPLTPSNPNLNPTISVLHPMNLANAKVAIAQRFGLAQTGAGNAPGT